MWINSTLIINEYILAKNNLRFDKQFNNKHFQVKNVKII
jgi:hypothetical protein